MVDNSGQSRTAFPTTDNTENVGNDVIDTSANIGMCPTQTVQYLSYKGSSRGANHASPLIIPTSPASNRPPSPSTASLSAIVTDHICKYLDSRKSFINLKKKKFCLLYQSRLEAPSEQQQTGRCPGLGAPDESVKKMTKRGEESWSWCGA